MAEEKHICSVESCGKTARSRTAQLCEMHYARVRRHGSTDKKSNLKPGLLEHSGEYLLEHLPGHPLSRASKRVYQHRAVFHQHHGDGPFRCHWCSKPVTWDDMHVDHLNDQVQDNRIENLVASCPQCNQKRGLPKMRHAMKSGGHLVTAHGLTMCISDWSRRLGLSRWTLISRLDKGMRPDQAMVSTRANTGPRRKRQPDSGYAYNLSAAHHSRDKQREEARL